jgi:hypothetical protein
LKLRWHAGLQPAQSAGSRHRHSDQGTGPDDALGRDRNY